MYVVLTTIYTDNPSIEDWLGIGPAIRTEAGITDRRPPAPRRVRLGAAPARGRPPEDSRPTSSDARRSSRRRGCRRRTRPSPWSTRTRAAGACAEPPPRPCDRSPPAVIAASTGLAPASSDRDRRRRAAAPGRGRHADLVAPGRRSARSASSRGCATAGRRPRCDRTVSATLVGEKAAGGSTGSTCGSSSSSSSPSMTLRMFRLAEPYQMHFDEVYHARTADRVPPGLAVRRVARHLRVDPPAPRQVRDGRRARPVGRGRRRRHERARRPGPRRRSSSRVARMPAAPGGRAGERLHVATGIGDPDLRPAVAGARSPRSRRPACQRAGARPEQPARWSSATTTGASRPSTSTRSAPMPPRPGWRPLPLGQVGGAVERLFVPDDGATIIVGRSATGSTSWTSTVGRTSAGSTCRAGRHRPGGSGDALQATLADVPDPAAAAATWPSCSTARRPTTRRSCAGAGETAYLGEPGERRRAHGGRDRDLRRPAAGHRDRRRSRASPRRPPRASRSSTRPRVQVTDHGPARRRRARPRARHGHRGRPAVRDVGHGRRADLQRRRGRRGRGRARARPRSARRIRCPGLGRDVVYDPASQMVHILGLAPDAPVPRRTGPRPGRGPSTSSSRTATRSSRTPGSPDGFTPVALGCRHQRRVPIDRPPGPAGLRRGRVDRLDRARVARVRLALARGHRRGPDARLSLPAREDPVPAPARRRAGRAVRPRRRHVLRPVAHRHERRLRRAVHRRRVHASSPPSGPAGGAAGPRSGSRCRSSACSSGSRWRASGSRSTPSAAWRCSSSCGAPSGGSSPILGLIALTSVLGYLAISVPEGAGVREPDLPVHHGRADPARGRRRDLPSHRLDRRGDAVRGHGARGARRARLLRRARDRPARPGRSSSARSRSRPLLLAILLEPRLARGVGDLRHRRAGSGSGRSRPRPGRTTRPATSSHPHRRRRAGSAPAGCSGCPVAVGGRSASSPSRSRCTWRPTSRGR